MAPGGQLMKASKKGKKDKPANGGGIDANLKEIAAMDVKGKGRATMPAVTAGKKPKKEGRKVSGKAATATAVPAPFPAVAAEEEEELDEAGLLLREIKSLGGDEEDFKFLKDVDVDDEDEAIVNDNVEDKKLAKDLKSFLATLGDLGQAYGDDEEQQEDDAELSQDEEDSDSEGSGSEQISEADEQVATAPAPKAPEEAIAALLTPAPVPQKPAPVSRSGMLVDPNPLWYDIELPELASVPSGTAAPSTKTIDQLQKRGTRLLDEMNETFSGSLTRTDAKNDKLAMSSTLSASDRAFISTILQSGTSSDKLSALMLLSSSSPIHTMTYLNQLASLTTKKSRDEAVRAIRAIVDWLKGGAGGTGTAGLPDRKLRWFAEQPDLPKVVFAREYGIKQNGKQPGDEHILVWAFEDWLKKWYFELLKAIETLSHDPLPFVRTQMTGFLASLLSSKPEQEQNLLRLLVDKLGDSDRTVSSRTSYHLLQLLQNHPMMKTIVVREVAALVLRPTASAPIAIASGQHGKKGSNGPSAAHPSAAAGMRSSDHSRYYSIITLNQIMLSRTDLDKLVANRLIEVYFDIFKDLLGNYSEEEDEKGPQAEEMKGRKQRRDEQKGGKRKRDQQAAEKLKALPRKERRRIEKSQQALEAESKIMAAVLTGVNRAFPYSEIEGDVLHQRADVLFRIIHTGTFNVGIQALTLIFQVSSKQQAVSDRFYRALYDTLTDTRLANSSKQAMYLNLLFKAIKADTSAKRVAAFVKRILQTLGSHQPPFICGSLYLLGELFNITPSLRNMLSDPEDADDDVENFKDAPESAEEADEEVAASSSTRPTTSYDGRKRDPQFANAHNSCLWEISPLLHHFHPSVALHASQLLSATTISTTPDLELHTLSHFLDRFVYRNAKKTVGGSDSVMKPGAKGLDRSGMVLMRKGTTAMSDARVNADDFVKKQAADVPVDQLFFHKYFNQKLEDEKSKEVKSDRRKRRGDADANDDDISLGDSDDDGDESVDEDEELEQVGETDLSEKEIWKAMQASMPKAAGEDDEDDDLMADEDEDSDDVADFAYSDSEESAVDVESVEEEEEEPQSFFPDEDDDELEGFAEEDDDVIGSDEDVDMPSITDMPESKRAKKRKLKHLPAFADADDWKALIDAGDSDA